MKKLIRPFLSAVAQLGLFLSLAAWIAGQRWQTNLTIGPLGISNTQSLWSFGWDSRFSDFSVNTTTGNEAAINSNYSNLWFRRLQTSPGIAFRRWATVWIMIKHWLLVTIFALSYAVLKYVYRKQPEVSNA